MSHQLSRLLPPLWVVTEGGGEAGRMQVHRWVLRLSMLTALLASEGATARLSRGAHRAAGIGGS